MVKTQLQFKQLRPWVLLGCAVKQEVSRSDHQVMSHESKNVKESVTSQRVDIFISCQFFSAESRAVEDQLSLVFPLQIFYLVSQQSFDFIMYKATAFVFTLFVQPLHVHDCVNHGRHVLVGVHYTCVCVHS